MTSSESAIQDPPPVQQQPQGEFPQYYDGIERATGNVIARVDCTAPEQMPAVFAKAREAQKVWSALSPADRRERILTVRDYILHHMEEITVEVSRATGKTRSDALVSETLTCLLSADYYAKKARRYLKKRTVYPSNILFANKRSYLTHYPLGVVGIISPWNYPLNIPFGEIIMGLMAGNAVVFKVSEDTPTIGSLIERILAAGNLPDGLCQFTMGHGAQIAQSWLEQGVDKIFFTGSVRVGHLLMKKAAEYMTPVSLELGGNDAMIVLEDANLERAANGALWAGFANAGQSCAGVERLYVQEAVYDEFIEILARKTNSLRQGFDRGLFDVELGPMCVDRQLSVINRHVQDALQHGARITAQSTIHEQDPSKFYPATLLADCNHDMQVMREETFGPVIAVMPFKSESEAIHLANDSDLGLTSSVWTKSNERGRRVADRLETGVTCVNDHLYTQALPELPWLGWKNSGRGVTHSYLGLHEMTRAKVVNYDLVPNLNTQLWWFPVRRLKYLALVDTAILIFSRTLVDKIKAVRRLLPRIKEDPLFKEKMLYLVTRFQSRGQRVIRRRFEDKE